MVAAKASESSSQAAGCGASATGSRGPALAGGAYERGRVALNYSILGSSMDQFGKLAVAPGALVVLAVAVPDQGGYMVASVRPRVPELQTGYTAPVTISAPPVGADRCQL